MIEVPIDEPFLDQCLALTHDLTTANGAELRALPAKGMALLAQLFLWGEQKRSPTASEDLVSRACTLIRDNIDKRTPLPKLCKSLPVSYSWLRTLFAREMGYSMDQYMIRCRVDRALSLLSTGMNVKQVSSKLGYTDPFAFSTQFKKITGFPPTRHPGIG